ncbi:hypothetical protein GCM10010401_06820 [Rarobacter faecitabidus]|uniref:Acetyltransferase (GNAT) family protein n=1 Tax=Rarobacter faecitabidus TaxID=13243 RepID=A0A542ZTM0_RARFA|nr:GNAT family N-acetyltransferase [Rarobacter faecitabidus]TQL63570.1 acetyltransferase (GNAT) family protein [Rarobacter faecitabidus]
MTTTPELEIREIAFPASVDLPDAADFVSLTATRNEMYRERYRSDDMRLTPHELLVQYHNQTDAVRRLWLLLIDDEPVGRLGLDLPNEPGSRVALISVELLARAQGKGLGAAALSLAEREAAAAGRTRVQGWTAHPGSAPERLAAPTGFGSIPLDRAARFLLGHGYALEQIERKSVLTLPGSQARLRALLDEACAAAGPDYEFVSWELPTPTEFVDGYALVKSRMSTDIPSAGMEFDAEVWDAARVERHDRTFVAGGFDFQVGAVRHVPSGQLVAFSELMLGSDKRGTTSQEDTLVLREHRGHRLGMLVKCANLLAWRERFPDSPRVTTFNAEENRPMLDINERMGFVPDVYEGAWQKDLA